MSLLKTIGSSGQISLGKEYAGSQVIVDQPSPGVWIIKVGQFVPNNEAWLHEPETQQKLDKAIALAEKTSPKETDLNELKKELGSES